MIVVIETETEEIGKGTGIENDIVREVGNAKMRGIGKEMIGIVVVRLLVLVTLLPYEEEMERPRKRQEKAFSSMARNTFFGSSKSKADTRQLRRPFVQTKVY